MSLGGVEVDPSTIPGLKFATPRDETRRTLGHVQGAFAEVWIGRRCPGCGAVGLMPWQQLAANILGELDAATGLPYYDLGVVTVPRQAGKSDLCVVCAAERCVSRPGFRSWYTAQTGQDARDEFLKFYDDTLADTALRTLLGAGLKRGKGDEVATWPNRSHHRPHPPTEQKLHGKQSDRNDVDEGWAFDEEDGKALLQAIAPTQLTRPGAQTIVWSAGGTPRSTWLAGLVARGRASVEALTIAGAEAPARMAYLELGVPDDLDIRDLAAVEAHHPAIGHTIPTLRGLRNQLPDDDEFARAAGNRWTSVIGSAIDSRMWEGLRYGEPIPDGALLGWGAARAEDGSHVVVACAADLGDGRVVVEVADVLPTSYRAGEFVAGWVARDATDLDPSGPTAALAEELAARPNVHALTAREASAACQDLLDGMRARRILFRQNTHTPTLDASARVAQKRPVADGGVMWSRSTSAGSVAALEAATWAVRARKRARRPGKPGGLDTPRETK